MSASNSAELAALAAATPQAAQQDTGAARQFLTFNLGGSAYALNLLRVREIIEFDRLTTVPMMPRQVRGVINLRGAVVPVIDLSVSFAGSATQTGRRSCIIIVEMNETDGTRQAGVLVDAVNEVMDISPADLEPPPSFGAGIPTRCIQAMAKTAQGLLIVLDIDRLIAAPAAGAASTLEAAEEAETALA
jgi:purine-binding chemotaxis protein CheW